MSVIARLVECIVTLRTTVVFWIRRATMFCTLRSFVRAGFERSPTPKRFGNWRAWGRVVVGYSPLRMFPHSQNFVFVLAQG